jgi:hypothetical protein
MYLTSPMAYEPPATVVRAPLAPPAGYAEPSQPLPPNGKSPYVNSEPPTGAHMVWHTSPRWAAVTGKDGTLVTQDPQAKFKAAQAKAAKVGVENLSKEDLDGLNPAQLKELRGY